LNEFELIARYFQSSQYSDDVLLGVGDDAAVVTVPDGFKLVTSVDTIVEGVHFPNNSAAADIAYRALAVNLSDMAAMGAIPKWFTLSLCIPTIDETWMNGFAKSLNALASQFKVQLIGGDTVKGPLNISVQIMGVVEQDHWLTRSGAQPDDLIVVSGKPGEAAGGLRLLMNAHSSLHDSHHEQQLIERFLRPVPRIALGRELRSIAHAAMDMSDGLLTDLKKLCFASNCGARLQLDDLPKSSLLAAMFDPEQCEQLILNGGDDYELLFTIPSASLQQLISISNAIGVRCTLIGVITAGDQVECMRGNEQVTVADSGYDHFK
jgi:thiamine-monophosphate kinase